MQAFPKDSLNNVMGGGGPLNKRPDHSTFLGNHNEEAFTDFSLGGQAPPGYEPYDNGAIRPGPTRTDSNVMSATAKVEPIHGDESLGLGTSTFLEGAPASRTAIQRRETDSSLPEMNGGLSRKKSLAQKIRGISNNRREFAPSGRMTNPEGALQTPPEGSYTPGAGPSKARETNPFFNEYSDEDKKKGESKGESITIVEPERKAGRARAPSSPRRGFGERLERRVTGDGSEGTGSGGGFLARVKSLKGGRKPRDPRPLI